MNNSYKFYKVENNQIVCCTLKEEVAFVASQIKDNDLRDLYLYYYNQYIKPNAPIWVFPDGAIEFNDWYEDFYDDYETDALVKVVNDILSKTAGDISYKKAQVELKKIQANQDFI